jgi:uncharacterized protein YbjQ (UPF0145 family)
MKPVHNQTKAYRKKMREARDIEIRRLYNNGNGFSMDAIVLMKHYSKHTIFRAIHPESVKGRLKNNNN